MRRQDCPLSYLFIHFVNKYHKQVLFEKKTIFVLKSFATKIILIILRVDCGSPPDIPFGYVYLEASGSVAKYVCHPGYKIFGNEFIYCKANGTWGTLSTGQARCHSVGSFFFSLQPLEWSDTSLHNSAV
jgi:hypothetical protein